tara:strand:+ start:277 stop:1251 length:975 start_codon:yes stop_codon:yes gene_type:complete
MAIDFPNSPSTGDLHTVNGKQWQWDAEKWIAYGVSLAPDVLKVDSGNNRVGINQTSPAYSLDVTGTARITGDLTVQGTTTTIESAAVNTSLVFEGATADSYETTLTLVDPTADRTITLPNATGTVALTDYVPTTITVADTTDTTAFVALWESATGDLAPKSDAGITYNAGTGTLTATAFAGPLTGNVTGNASGTALTVTQAAQSAITSVGTLTSLTVSGGLVAPLQINTQTGSYTLVLADAGKAVLMNVGSANNLTIPPNSSVAFDVGTQIVVTMIGAGVTTIVDGSGVTTNSKDNKAAIDGQYASVSLIKTATDTWLVTGALA